MFGVEMPVAMQLFGVGGHGARFLFGVPHALHLDLLAWVAFGPQCLAQAALVGGDQAGCRAEDRGRRTVIPFEADDFRTWKIALEAQDVFHFRAAPGIDRLIVVAHDTDIAGAARQQLEPQILDDIGILVFVDQHVAEAFAIFGEDFRLRAQDGQRVEQQIAEIGGVQRFEPLLIGGIERCVPCRTRSPALRHRGHRKAAVRGSSSRR